MKENLGQLKINFEKIRAIGELYDDLMAKGAAGEKELEEAMLRYSALRDTALKLLLHSKKIVEKIEKEDIP